MIVIPKPTKPNSGLAVRKGRWFAEYTVDGRRRRKALGTTDPEAARLARDTFYAHLRANEGAVTAGDPALREHRRHAIDPASPRRYIHHIANPWRVQVGVVIVGHYATREEAIAARNAYLQIP